MNLENVGYVTRKSTNRYGIHSHDILGVSEESEWQIPQQMAEFCFLADWILELHNVINR